MESHGVVTHDGLNTPQRPRLSLVPLVFLGVFFAVPLANILVAHVRASTLLDILRNGSMRGILWFTLWQAVLSTVMTLAVGLPVTWALSKWRFFGSHVLTGIITVPFLMPGVVVAAGVLAVMPDRGLMPILWAHVVFNTAVVLRVVGPRWAMVDPAMEETAASLGAPPWRVFTQVTWPTIRQSILNAASIVFVFCFSSFAVIAILGGPTMRTLETEVFTQAVRLGNTRVAIMLTVIQTIVIVAVLWVGHVGSGDITDRFDSTSIRGQQRLGERWHLRYAPPFIALIGTLLVAVPMVAVLGRSLRIGGGWSLAGFRALFNGTLEGVGINPLRSILLTVLFAVVTVLIAVPLAVMATADSRRTGRSLTEQFTLAPLVFSTVTLGLGIIVTFSSGFFDWRGSAWLIPVVHAVMALPLAVRALSAARKAIGDELFETAADLGAGPRQVWRTIEVPLLRPALLHAAGISAAVSIGEFGATSFLTRNGTTTVPIAIGQLIGRPGALLEQSGFALAALIAVACALLAIWV